MVVRGPHLPPPFSDQETYDRIYAHLYGIDEIFPGSPDDWREIRLSPGLPAADVYRRLPVAAEIEFAGYLTRTRIRYAAGGPTGAYTIGAKACGWHSHPQKHPYPDLPSDLDVYHFLRWRVLRHITVGKSLIWTFDKTPATLETVTRLNAWEGQHMLSAIGEVGFADYPALALRHLGLCWPRSPRRRQRTWPRLLEQSLNIQVTLLQKESGRR